MNTQNLSSGIAVVMDPATARYGEAVVAQGTLPAYAAAYIQEILRHAGISFDLLVPEALGRDLAPYRLLILAQDLDLTGSQQAQISNYVQNGGALIGIAGTSGLDDLFGCRTLGAVAEGYLQPPAASHPVTGGLGREVHIFGGQRVKATTATVLARAEYLSGGEGSESVDAIIEHPEGQGWTLLFAPDLVTSVLHIQQGKPVTPPAPRESLGTPAGSILDSKRDQDTIEINDIDELYYSHAGRDPEGRRIFSRQRYLEPMVDRLRELLIRGIFQAFSRIGAPLPLLWYWPRGLSAIAHLSHDTDGNRQYLGWTLFNLLQELDVRSTWCTMPVPGYTREFYNTLVQEGYEIALHYATGNAPVREDHRWSQKDFNWQYDTLIYQTRLPRLLSNKNHGLAWQGRLDFYYWCQARGIQLEQSRGDFGFTFGTCHPWFPLEDDRPDGAFLDVLALCFLTQDLTVVCPLGFMRPMVDKCYDAYGVAHFLFHPSHLEDPLCVRAIREMVAYTRSKGMEWWTSAAISNWERARRQASISASAAPGTYQIQAPAALDQATLLCLVPDSQTISLSLDGHKQETTVVERYGFRFIQAIADLSGEHTLQIQE